MAGEDDEEGLDYLQAFASVQKEQGKSGIDDEEFEALAGDNTKGKADDKQIEGNDDTYHYYALSVTQRILNYSYNKEKWNVINLLFCTVTYQKSYIIATHPLEESTIAIN